MSSTKAKSEAVRFERGFKTWAENASLSFRSRLGLDSTDPLPYGVLADHLGVRVLTPRDIPGLAIEVIQGLLSAEADEWSAVSLRAGRIDVVIMNPSHSPRRQSSDVMHELAHIIRGHNPAQVYMSAEAGVGIRAFQALQEAEADWLAGCLLLPRPALVRCAAQRMSTHSACELYMVSADLLRYRMNVTGVSLQFRRIGERRP